jgi:hypothetical protein
MTRLRARSGLAKLIGDHLSASDQNQPGSEPPRRIASTQVGMPRRGQSDSPVTPTSGRVRLASILSSARTVSAIRRSRSPLIHWVRPRVRGCRLASYLADWPTTWPTGQQLGRLANNLADPGKTRWRLTTERYAVSSFLSGLVANIEITNGRRTHRHENCCINQYSCPQCVRRTMLSALAKWRCDMRCRLYVALAGLVLLGAALGVAATATYAEPQLPFE